MEQLPFLTPINRIHILGFTFSTFTYTLDGEKHHSRWHRLFSASSVVQCKEKAKLYHKTGGGEHKNSLERLLNNCHINEKHVELENYVTFRSNTFLMYVTATVHNVNST